MSRLFLMLACAVALIVMLVHSGLSEDLPRSPASVTGAEKQIRAILAAKHPREAAAAYQTLFKGATTGDVRWLQMNASDTVAIQAAWEEVERTVPEKSDQAVRPDRDKLSRFLGFLDGRARLQAPQWWAEAILDAWANRRGNIYAGGINLRGYSERKPSAVAPPPQARFDTLEGKPVVRVGSEFAPIPDDLREKLGRPGLGGGVCALITSTHSYIALYDSFGYPYKLACVERSPAKIRWVADVWGSWWANAAGQHHQWVEVTEQGDRVAVFGVAAVGFHAEAFRISDGANIFRCSNGYSIP